jgi:hypothetical protein
MSPPAEQLIRGYIRRLSVAAQGRLNREQLRALKERTRGHIEHNTGLSGPATTLEVAGVLSRLGDPALVVAHELQRLAGTGGDAGEPPPAPRINRLARASWHWPARLGASWHWRARPGSLAHPHAVLTGGRADAAGSNAAPEEANVGARDLTERGAGAGDEPAETTGTQAADAHAAGPVDPRPVSGLEALGLIGSRQDAPGGPAGALSDAGPGGSTPVGPGSLAELIPAQAGESADLNGTLPEAAAQGRFARAGQPAAAAPQRPSWPHGPAIRRDAADAGQARQDAADEAAVEAEDQAAVDKAEADGLAVVNDPGTAGELAEGLGPGYADQRAAGEVVASGGPSTGELTAVDLPAVDPETGAYPRFPRIRRASAAVVRWTRDKTLESVATILLGLGGVIFPPIWLLGAMLALASKVWDYRDKWLGLAIPIVLTIVGTAAGLILAGSQTSFGYDVHIGWVSADIASRVSAALSAAYLAWRSVHGRRPDAVPPWNKPYHVG